MAAVSACMITFNNSRTVEKALKSVASWASEIIVVDSFSTDNTFEIVKEYATTSEQRQWPGFRDQYNYCISRAKNDWVIFLDADEEISPELAEEVFRRLERWYGVKIEVLDPSVNEFIYTATIKNESLEQIMKLLEYTSPVKCSFVRSQQRSITKIVIRKNT